jgi:hypothetical protein
MRYYTASTKILCKYPNGSFVLSFFMAIQLLKNLGCLLLEVSKLFLDTIKSCWAISHVSSVQKPNVSETPSASIIRGMMWWLTAI